MQKKRVHSETQSINFCKRKYPNLEIEYEGVTRPIDERN